MKYIVNDGHCVGQFVGHPLGTIFIRSLSGSDKTGRHQTEKVDSIKNFGVELELDKLNYKPNWSNVLNCSILSENYAIFAILFVLLRCDNHH